MMLLKLGDTFKGVKIIDIYSQEKNPFIRLADGEVVSGMTVERNLDKIKRSIND